MKNYTGWGWVSLKAISCQASPAAQAMQISNKLAKLCITYDMGEQAS